MLRQLLGLRTSVIQAPMFGVSTPALVAEVVKHGALGSYGAGVSPPTIVRKDLEEIARLVPDKRFNLNVFVESASSSRTSEHDSAANWNTYDRLLEPVRAALQLGMPSGSVPEPPASFLDDHLALAQEFRPAVVSFCFGVLDGAVVRDLQAFALVVGTATSVEEAAMLADAGVDAIVAQGSEAGGHRGGFIATRHPTDALIGSMALIPQICDAVGRSRIPVIAAGGISDARHVQAAIALGADAVQVGTAFVGTPESGASREWKLSLGPRVHPSTGTTVTRGLTGRPARMLRNKLVDALQPHEALAASSPWQRQRMRDIFQRKNAEYMGLLAGGAGTSCRQVGTAVHTVE
ncbi:hypothetical protein, variant [Aphanomyces invadans]|uniref:Uncharacterized protein n=1 Tax=Aphanomyces invadans TaxID=157072 RepID=A0A024UF52_9STRA|nr:hypothetical protein, variant [Aphanomyces invadans]ETW04502.1 hypothetical protein, variant [Aphanomyces invadans]|eukprot:XP_008867458.1 hypothetical protein, variant [Aphanomyces invadans]